MAYKSSINTGLPNIPDPPDPSFFAEFTRIYNAIRNLTIALDAYTGSLTPAPSEFSGTAANTSLLVGNQTKVYVESTETITVGKCVNLYDSSGLKARLSNAGVSGKRVHGWCSAVGTAGWIEVRLLGLASVFIGLTPGTTYYASNTAGAISTTAGSVPQKLGYAISSSQLFFRPDLI